MVLGSWIVSLTVRSTDLTDVGQGLGISSELHFSKKKKIKKKQTKTLCRRGTSPLCKNINAILIKTDLLSPPSHYLLSPFNCI